MRQQVNLYQPLFRRQEKVLSALTLLQASVLIVVVLALIYGFGLWQAGRTEQQVSELEQRRDESMARLLSVTAEFPPRQKDPHLPGRIAEAESRLLHSQRLLQQLARRELGNNSGLAEHLAALARQKPAELWLTRVQVGAGGQALQLAGSTHHPASVPRYLQALSDEATFQGLSFHQLGMWRSDETPQQVDFLITTEQQEGP